VGMGRGQAASALREVTAPGRDGPIQGPVDMAAIGPGQQGKPRTIGWQGMAKANPNGRRPTRE